MKKFKRFIFIISMVTVFLLNLLISFDSPSGISNAHAVMGTVKYEDKFDVEINIPGGISIGVCCDPDITNGCWRWAWPTC